MNLYKMVWVTRTYLINKASEWIRKGDHENYPFNGFFSYFVAYNILYNLYARIKNPSVDLTTNDKNRSVKVHELIRDPGLFIHSNDVNIRSFIYLLRKFRKEKWTRKSKESINDSLERSYINRNYKLVTRDVLRMLYKLRCNMFHGEKNMNAPNQHELIEVSNKILKTILSEIFLQLQASSI